MHFPGLKCSLFKFGTAMNSMQNDVACQSKLGSQVQTAAGLPPLAPTSAGPRKKNPTSHCMSSEEVQSECMQSMLSIRLLQSKPSKAWIAFSASACSWTLAASRAVSCMIKLKTASQEATANFLEGRCGNDTQRTHGT